MTHITALHSSQPAVLHKVSSVEVSIYGVNMSSKLFLKRMTDMGFKRKETARILDRLSIGGVWALSLSPIQEYYLKN